MAWEEIVRRGDLALRSRNFVDEDGNPAGGSAFGHGYAIAWQNGPLCKDGLWRSPNGAFVEDVISAVIARIQFYQDSRFACVENAEALRCLKEAMEHLDSRTKDRRSRGVEGTHKV